MSVRVVVSVAQQMLRVYNADTVLASYPVSTAKNGVGERENSGCTPRGAHVIAEKIGADALLGAVFVARQATGEIYSPALAAQYPQRDWILSRILWLAGLDAGKNQGDGCDTYRRYIYIHGTPDTEPMGVPLSHGCIRMRNRDVAALFAQVAVGTRVDIVEESLESAAKSG